MLPYFVALLWLMATIKLSFPGDGTLPAFARAVVSGELRDRWTELQIGHWFVAMLATMFVVDRLYCAWTRWRVGVDPMKVHWTRLLNRDGAYICAHCLSPFLLPPEDLDEDKMVSCGDCGEGKARYGDMKPHLKQLPSRLAE
jgi:hypothetical protein